jgi:hypothetical protein
LFNKKAAAANRRSAPISPRNRKALTTWQDAVALRHLKEISVETGLSQQMLIAEGINHVLQKYGKPSVAT